MDTGTALPRDLPKHILPWPLLSPHKAVLALPSERHAYTLRHEPQEPHVALVQGPLHEELQGNVAGRKGSLACRRMDRIRHVIWPRLL